MLPPIGDLVVGHTVLPSSGSRYCNEWLVVQAGLLLLENMLLVSLTFRPSGGAYYNKWLTMLVVRAMLPHIGDLVVGYAVLPPSGSR